MSDLATPTSWPAHDPGTYRRVPDKSTPLSPERAEQLLAQRVGAVHLLDGRLGRCRTGRRAGRCHSGSPPRSSTGTPIPISIKSAKGAWLTDVDGRQMLDLSMGFGAMLVGHLNPRRRRARRACAARDRHAVRDAVAAGNRCRRALPPPVRAGHDPVHQLRHRVADVRDPGRPGVHRPQGDHQDRGRLPRRLRRAAGLGEACPQGHRPGRRPDRRRAVRRRGRHGPRRRRTTTCRCSSAPWRSTAPRWRPWSSSR